MLLNLVYPNVTQLEIERRCIGKALIAPFASSITLVAERHCCRIFLSLSLNNFSLSFLWFGFQLSKKKKNWLFRMAESDSGKFLRLVNWYRGEEIIILLIIYIYFLERLYYIEKCYIYNIFTINHRW